MKQKSNNLEIYKITALIESKNLLKILIVFNEQFSCELIIVLKCVFKLSEVFNYYRELRIQ